MSDNQKTTPDNRESVTPQPVVQQSAKPNGQNTSRYQLFNNGGATLSVPIVNKATGETDMVFVQHGGRPKLAQGFIVDPVFASRNPALQATKLSS